MKAYTALLKQYDSIQKSLKPDMIADFADMVVESLLSGLISDQEAFRLQNKIEKLHGYDPRIARNCIRLAHTMWDLIEYSADLLVGNTDDFVLSKIQNGLTELYGQTYVLEKNGWESVVPFLRAYYDIRQEIGIVQSFTFTAFIVNEEIRWMQPADFIYSALESMLKSVKSLPELEKKLPQTIGKAKLRDTEIGFTLESNVLPED